MRIIPAQNETQGGLIRFSVDPVPEVRSIGMTAEGASWHLPVRVIGEYEWIVCVGGRVRFLVEETHHVLDPGDALLLEPDVRHSIDWVGEEGCSFYFVHFMPEGNPVHTTRQEETVRAESLREALHAQLAAHPFFVLPRTRMTEVALPVFSSLGQQQDTICTLFEHALAERSHYAVDSQLLIGQFVAQMLVYASRAVSFGDNPNMISEEGAMDRTLQDALARIHADTGVTCSIRDLAGTLGVSQQYLSRLFTQRLGMPPLHYVNRLRLNQAKALMRKTRMNIQEIAWACGFTNPYYFSRLFRKFEGESPTRFRNRLDFRNNK